MRDFQRCGNCGGSGRIAVDAYESMTCWRCKGSGLILVQSAPGLRGSAADNSFMEGGL